MSARARQPRDGKGREGGHALLIVVVMVVVMIVGSTVAMKVWSTVMKREKEEELIFRGRQYAMALFLYRKQMGQLPPDLKKLEEKISEKGVFVLRRPYKDPITGGEFGLVFAGPNNTPIPDEPLEGGDQMGLDLFDDDDQGSDSGGPGIGNPAPGNPSPGNSGPGSSGPGMTSSFGNIGGKPSAFGTPSGGTGMPIMGVHSKSKDEVQGPARWRDLEHYNEWLFLITDITPNLQPGQSPGLVMPGQQIPRGQPPPGTVAPGGLTPGGIRGATPGPDRTPPK